MDGESLRDGEAETRLCHATVTVGRERLATPAGTFPVCLKVSCHLIFPDRLPEDWVDDRIDTFWFAPEAGLVRRSISRDPASAEPGEVWERSAQ